MRSGSERPACGRAATWSSTMTAIGWRWARSASAAGIQAPLRVAATGVGAGGGLGGGGGVGGAGGARRGEEGGGGGPGEGEHGGRDGTSLSFRAARDVIARGRYPSGPQPPERPRRAPRRTAKGHRSEEH